MAGRALADRVDILEQQVNLLERLPMQVAALTELVASGREEFLQFRTETRMEFSAIREVLPTLATKDELRTLATKDELRTLATKDEMRALATKDELRALATTVGRLEAGIAESRRHATILIEDVRDDIRMVAEHLSDLIRRTGSKEQNTPGEA